MSSLTRVQASSPHPPVHPRAAAPARPRRLTLTDLLLEGISQALAANHTVTVARRARPMPTDCLQSANTVQAPGTAQSPTAKENATPAQETGVEHEGYPSFGLSSGAPELTEAERRHAAGLMRVNHVGEVCAQALYHGQAAGAADPALRFFFLQSAAEECDHLAWTRQRLDELQSHPSALNPLWYAGAYSLGLLAARAGDARSLGFTVETERQVEEHLAGHMERLPQSDVASRAIVSAMKDDEVAHGQAARRLGAAELPAPVKWAMRLAARVMTTTAYRI